MSKLRPHGAAPSLPVTSLFREAQRHHLYRFHVESLAIFELIPDERVDIPNPNLMAGSFPVG